MIAFEVYGSVSTDIVTETEADEKLLEELGVQSWRSEIEID